MKQGRSKAKARARREKFWQECGLIVSKIGHRSTKAASRFQPLKKNRQWQEAEE
jgi:hypothetical protein